MGCIALNLSKDESETVKLSSSSQAPRTIQGQPASKVVRSTHSISHQREASEKGLLKHLSEQFMLGENQFKKSLLESLKQDEALTLRSLTDHHWFEEHHIDMEMVGAVILNYYKDDIFEGLDNFGLIKPNKEFCALNLQSFVETAWQEDPKRIQSWLLENPDFFEVENSFDTMGALSVRSQTSTEIDENIHLILKSDIHSTAKASYLGGVYANWIKSDFDGALQHLVNLPQSSTLDHAISRVLFDVAKVDIEAAQKWAEHISDKQLSEIALKDVLSIKESQR